MARRVKALPKTYGAGQRSKYPWDAWLDGSIWKISKDVDFFSDPMKFRAQIYKAAHKRNMKVTIRVIDNDLYFTAIRKG